ncbi:hypothetical protein E2C01_026689 [Portunus trituberculatus]|uniref:Uncharacterized protein n=1 Tax=Portunus trituberculatus TaxID=210409 RepID=A0A5B7EGS3_PORTR|nr:hypothetical protein [Portunus trituberculatus]
MSEEPERKTERARPRYIDPLKGTPRQRTNMAGGGGRRRRSRREGKGGGGWEELRGGELGRYEAWGVLTQGDIVLLV